MISGVLEKHQKRKRSTLSNRQDTRKYTYLRFTCDVKAGSIVAILPLQLESQANGHVDNNRLWTALDKQSVAFDEIPQVQPEQPEQLAHPEQKSGEEDGVQSPVTESVLLCAPRDILFFRHSCTPSTFCIKDSNQTAFVVTARDCSKGEEATIAVKENVISYPFWFRQTIMSADKQIDKDSRVFRDSKTGHCLCTLCQTERRQLHQAQSQQSAMDEVAVFANRLGLVGYQKMLLAVKTIIQCTPEFSTRHVLLSEDRVTLLFHILMKYSLSLCAFLSALGEMSTKKNRHPKLFILDVHREERFRQYVQAEILDGLLHFAHFLLLQQPVAREQRQIIRRFLVAALKETTTKLPAHLEFDIFLAFVAELAASRDRGTAETKDDDGNDDADKDEHEHEHEDVKYMWEYVRARPMCANLLATLCAEDNLDNLDNAGVETNFFQIMLQKVRILSLSPSDDVDDVDDVGDADYKL
jgi:hypothetical protein